MADRHRGVRKNGSNKSPALEEWLAGLPSPSYGGRGQVRKSGESSPIGQLVTAKPPSQKNPSQHEMRRGQTACSFAWELLSLCRTETKVSFHFGGKFEGEKKKATKSKRVWAVVRPKISKPMP